ncbi:hypothetical protein A1O3_05813 [Capronia epimyces CBS 606.96]|uniref:Uncharacterized protein n=1 Tax=Capronia epimyces CBS 606.96 TaxID=1182542 RepID=W9XY13_9EURO|nr:uncharacterized protein A1O3_05813 [Capronia epimyces CBS 606.96]EXJ85138.1 hypothetical protein A1O3_05813 [Capronia epimyces CBS 606.96]
MDHTPSSDGDVSSTGAAYPWVLEHLLAYPGTYEIPLRTMYTLNATTHNQQQSPKFPPSSAVPGNAFPRPNQEAVDEQRAMSTATAAAQLRANLMAHISQQPSQPTSLPPSFITSFVRRCFPPELEQVDFPQALTAMDYLKDLEIRRRREVVAAFEKLGIDRADFGYRDKLARKYPGVLKWATDIEERERKVQQLYTHVYLGLRRWTLINELSLTPFNKANCIAMLNTLYPPINIRSKQQFVPPTAHLTPEILSNQRERFFLYIKGVERKGPEVLSTLMANSQRGDDPTGWKSLRETLDNYLRMANSIIEECYEITGRGHSPTTASFGFADSGEEGRRKVDSAISFGSAASSNRNSGQSHATRPSTSSSFSTNSFNHGRQVSRDKQLPEKPLPLPKDDDITVIRKSSGSTLERIARELRKMKSRSNIKDEPRPQAAFHKSADTTMMDTAGQPLPTPAKDRSLKIKRSLRRMRSNTGLLDGGSFRPPSRGDDTITQAIPTFDAEEMKRKRQEWESQQKAQSRVTDVEMTT